MTSRSVSTVAIISSSTSRRLSSRAISALSRVGNARPSPVRKSSSRAKRSFRSGAYVIDALGRTKPFDAVDMLNTLGNQPTTLAMQTPGVFLFALGTRTTLHASGSPRR